MRTSTKRQTQKDSDQGGEALRAFANAIKEALLLIDAKGIILFANEAVAERFGKGVQELVGTCLYDLLPPELAKLKKEQFDKVFTTGEPVCFEEIGAERYFEIYCNPVFNEQRGVSGVIVFAHDITDRKIAEEGLRKSKSLYRTFIDASNDMVFLKDETGRYSIVNKGYLEYIGKREEDVIGKTGFEIRPFQIAEQCDLSDRKTLELNGIVVTEETANNRIIETRKFPVMLDENRIGIGGFMRDITENKLAAKRLLESEEKYRSIFENAVEGIYQSVPEGRFISVNPAMAHILGFASPEEIVTSIANIGEQLYVNPEERVKYRKILEERGTIKAFEAQLYTKDRGIIWVSLNTRVVKDAGGKVLYYEGTIEDINKRKSAEEELKHTLEQLRASLNATVKAMAVTIETRDPYTAGHQKRVANLARTIAQEMHLFKDVVDGIRVAGLVHDIGKIAIPAEILSKPSKLSEIEFNIIKGHAEAGYNILKDIEFPWPIADIVLQHHERLDGSGYPRELKGEQILLEAQILAVADVVEAMASYRPYRAGLGVDFALEEIEKKKGICYDKKVVDACMLVFREKGFRFE